MYVALLSSVIIAPESVIVPYAALVAWAEDMFTNEIEPSIPKSMAAKVAEAPARRRVDAKDFIYNFLSKFLRLE